MSSIALGRNLLIKKGEAVLAGLRTVNWSWAGSSIDITAGEINGFRALLDGSEQEQLDLSVDGIAKNAVLRKLALGMESRMLTDITITWPVNAPGDMPESISGNFRISSYSEGASYKDAVTFSAKLESSGPWVYVGGTAGGGDGGVGDGSTLDGRLMAIGRWQSLTDDFFNLQVDSGYLRGLAFTYDFELGVVDHIYQRPRLMSDGDELTKMAICAIDGDFAICCELDGLFFTRYVVVCEYARDSFVKNAGAWSPDFWNAGADFTMIDCGSALSPIDVVMVAKNNFIVVTYPFYPIGLTQWDIICVDYAASDDVNEKRLAVDLVALGLSGYEFVQAAMRVAVSSQNPDVACVVMFASGAGNTYRIETIFNPLTGDLISQGFSAVSASYDVPNIDSPMSGLDVVDDSAFSYIFSDFYYGYSAVSYGGFRMDGSWTEYGATLKYSTYDDRILSGDKEIFVDEMLVEVSMSPLVSAKLLSAGFTAVGSPKFGRISAFVK